MVTLFFSQLQKVPVWYDTLSFFSTVILLIVPNDRIVPSNPTALLDRDKYRAHAGHLHPRHTFIPASVDTYRHLGRPIMRYLRTLSDVASARSLAVTRGSFLASAHRERSVALVQSQAYVHRSCALLLDKASGRPVLPGADTPYVD
jgi:hypothetical protein